MQATQTTPTSKGEDPLRDRVPQISHLKETSAVTIAGTHFLGSSQILSSTNMGLTACVKAFSLLQGAVRAFPLLMIRHAVCFVDKYGIHIGRMVGIY
jgi:hypothetical protein